MVRFEDGISAKFHKVHTWMALRAPLVLTRELERNRHSSHVRVCTNQEQ